MRVTEIRDREEIERYLICDPGLHLYEIGDLDDFFWPHTVWYGGYVGSDLRAVALLYMAPATPVLIALSREPIEATAALVREIAPLLPSPLHAHLSPGLAAELACAYRVDLREPHWRMILARPERLGPHISPEVVQLGPSEREEVERFYGRNYPGNFFDPRMLETGYYCGIRRDGMLVSLGGVHVYSAKYRVAALGNVATDPSCRRQGLAAAVCSVLCQALLPTAPTIGLNVHLENAAAIALYERLGFEGIARFDEGPLDRLPASSARAGSPRID